VWPDAYYMGANATPRAYAFDRTRMLAGQPAGFLAFSPSAPGVFTLLLPADLDGPPPAAGAPGLFFRFFDGEAVGGGDRYELFEMQVDFDHPENAALTGPLILPVAPFASLCSFSFDCIPQPGTSQRLDSITEWPMWRLQYRNFGGYQTLVGNHAVDVGGGQAGVRWFELRKTGTGDWAVYQQGTHAPDEHSRWMASAALDGDGNLGLGYNVSSSSLYPSLRYTIHPVDAPPGTLQNETSLIEGGGAQTGSNRWGDYSAVVVDPADDCTFWFTGEYYAASASAAWRTYVGTFRVPGCGERSTADLRVAQTAASETIFPGAALTYALTLTNQGPADAVNVVLADTLPAQAVFLSGSGACAHSSGVFTCGPLALASGAVVTYTLAVQIPITQTGVLTNVVTVSSVTPDPHPEDNTAQVGVMVVPRMFWLPLLRR